MQGYFSREGFAGRLRGATLALACGLVAGLGLGLAPEQVWAQARTPLLIEGKTTLYQRVLTRPGAVLVQEPATGQGKAEEPFNVYFVYERKEVDGKAWLLVGPGSDGKTVGYLPETDTVAWRHTITLAFATPGNRERVLFFRERAQLLDFINAPSAADETKALVDEITAKGVLAPDSPVIAAEPQEYVDLKDQFYLLPVLQASSTLLKSGNRVRLVKVASVTRDEPVTAPTAPPAPDTGALATITNFSSAVVFVIDATSSMQPYIDRARIALQEVLRQAEEGKVIDRIRFGLVAYQDDPAQTKGMDYLSKVFVDPSQKATGAQFLAAMDSLKATRFSTRAFAEDGYAALDETLRKVNWQNYGGRYIVYITDASSREGGSALSSTKLSTEQMRLQAQERGVAIYSMHLKTPEGVKDHAAAETQYKQLSAWPGRGSLYFPVEAGDPARFESDVRRMAEALVAQVKAPEKTLEEEKSQAAAKVEDSFQETIDSVGRSMVLAYLGRQQGVKSPPMYESWASDRDVRNRAVPSFTVRVLLTKNQLSDLQSTLRGVLAAGEKGQIDPEGFFNQLRSAAVAMGRDPSRLGQGKAKNLEQAGLMGEYLEGLPYQSALMSMDLNEWTNKGVIESQVILDSIKSKIALYQRFHDDVDRWVKLHPEASDGDRVYPVPIDALP